MKKYFKTIYFAVALIAFNTSCEGDLDVLPQDSDLLLEDDFFSNTDSYRQLLAGVYANLSLSGLNGGGSSNISGLDAGTGQYIRGLWNLQNLSTDEAIFTFENDPGIRGLQRTSWEASNPLILGMFDRAVFSVTLANEFLRQTTDDALNSRGVSEALRADIAIFRAEARALRALSNYHLLDMFGRAPFITENDIIGDTNPPEEIVGEALFNLIESELLAIDDLLVPARQNEYGRMDQGAARMILAKLYLNAEVYTGTERYADCLTVCDQIIASGYSLTPNYLFNFLADNDTNGAQNEIIFPVINDGQVVQNFGGTTILIQGQVGSFEDNGESLGVSAGGFGGLFRLRREFSERFEDALFVNDQRNTIISEDRPISIETLSDPATGYILAKYSNRTSTGAPGSDLTFTDTDFPLFRLADVYLMYAEAHLRGGGGNAGTALGFVNQLRERAFGDTSGNIAANALTLDFIIDERSRELHWEAHRRQDLRRFGLFTGSAFLWEFKGDNPNGAPVPENLNLFPIPDADLATNPNLTQNPGY
ncbi:RagB/SusD family nutrient uptake outer membrane protein [Spongiimicrobium salis]|uniref:RagB/SusD family nutrient uptake outer membrane protein n=1 Tax=Spongiimicrobium salis TaxID=1667022 RepID=UPI00374CF82C